MKTPTLKLYHYWRSSSSWRVRWVFALKGISCEMQSVSLTDGESESPEHLKRHPAGAVPVLEFLDQKGTPGQYLRESIAISEWADENFPHPPLFPSSSELRAQARCLVEIINSGIHPLQNPPVQAFYSDDLEQRKKWTQHWIRLGLESYEKIVAPLSGLFSIGDALSLADICLIPQCYNAIRYQVNFSDLKTISKIYQNAIQTEGYLKSEPSLFEPKY